MVERIHSERGISVLLVEQRVAEALEACDYGYVLESGAVALEGKHASLMDDPKVKRAYLGM
jgi:branched-chain amino acid transport system ATP-binding protein